MTLVLMAKAFTLNETTPTNSNQRNSSNPSNMQIAQPVQNVKNQVVLNAVQNPSVQNVGNQNGLSVDPWIANQYGIRNGVTTRPVDNGAYDEIEEVNVNCTLKDNLQQASTSGTQTDSAFVYDSDGSAK
nr:hypothetical protein [Tanacetum cinerariifolium]